MTFVRDDELDQSGETALPARRFACPKCAQSGRCTAAVIATGEPYRVLSHKECKPC